MEIAAVESAIVQQEIVDHVAEFVAEPMIEGDAEAHLGAVLDLRREELGESFDQDFLADVAGEFPVDRHTGGEFYDVMMKMQRVRKRLGGFDWSIARDVADPAIWTERYHCPTWGDYLRMRDRYTQMDFDVQAEARSFDETPGGIVVRRRLERPYGSVRWKADSPDPHQDTMTYIGP